MEKTYTKQGYSYTNDSGKVVEVSRDMVVKSIADQTKLQTNITTNLTNLNSDLAAIDASPS